MGSIRVKTTYPNNPNYDYRTYLQRIDLDKKREESIMSGNGFQITQIQSTKKIIKAPNGIYSPKFGQGIGDRHPFEDAYRCNCGNLKGRKYAGKLCENCGTRVEKVGDNLSFFGWIVIYDYYTIHPALFKALGSYIGKDKLINIITPFDEKDENGFSIEPDRPKDEPFFGIGITKMHEKIDEILDFYYKPSKKDKYEDLVKDKDKIFTHSIPVFSLILRPTREDESKFTFEKTNKCYQMLTRLVATVNNKYYKGQRRNKSKEQLLFDITMKFQELYGMIEEILSGKKGAIRSVFSGRCGFSSRDVIVPGPKLRSDEIIMPYQAMVELLQQSIVNILQKSHNIGYDKAYAIWQRGQRRYDERIYNIIKSIIKSYPRGIPVLLNRNPTICIGSILQMYVVDVCKPYTLKVPLGILPALAADFDGDVLNVLYMINADFIRVCEEVLNPRNAMRIDRNDGKVNAGFLYNKDTLINLDSLLYLARPNYSKDQIDQIMRVKQME